MEHAAAEPHFVLVPWQGGISHIIPMTDIGRLLASHGAVVTIITTPANAPLVRSRVEDDLAAPTPLPPPPAAGAAATTSITVTAIPFAAAEAGLPEGCERLDLLRSLAAVPRFFAANKHFGEAVARYCRGSEAMRRRRPSCVVAGMCHTWALGMARDLGVPCYIFHGFGAFALLCIEYLYKHRPHEAVSSADELFSIPALPAFDCRVSRAQLPPHFAPATTMGGGTMQEIREFEVAVDGVVVNSFDELEHGSCELLAAATGGKTVVAVGPVSLCRRRCSSSLDPPQAMADDARKVMEWLDTKESSSVVYVSFGSAGCLPPAQVMQLGMALVSCPWHVVWVVKGADAMPGDVKNWLHESFVDGSKCLVVRGWAPQVAILAHRAVGGFLTHCGWGSTLEAIAAGVPMATWPLFAEQFLNERLIVDVLGVGVSVGVTKPTENVLTAGKLNGGGKADVEAPAEVGVERVAKAFERLMDQGAEGEERRRKAQKLKAKANGALEKGGSSYMNLEKLIQSSVSRSE